MASTFTVDAQGVPYQVGVSPSTDLEIIEVADSPDPHRSAVQWMHNDLATPIDLSSGPLFKHALIRVGPNQSYLYFRYHHILLDGYGQVLYSKRLADNFSAAWSGSSSNVSTEGEFSKLLQDQDDYRASADSATDVDFLVEKFTGVQESTSLRHPMPPTDPARRYRDWSNVGDLSVGAARYETHWSSVLLAASAAYAQKVSQSNDIVLGFPVRGRQTRAELKTPGMCANILPVRFDFSEPMTVESLVEASSHQIQMTLARQRARGEDLSRELRSRSQTSELMMMVVNIIAFDSELNFGEHTGQIHQISTGPVNDLTISVFGGLAGSNVSLVFEPNPDLHDERTVESHQQRFVSFVQRFCAADSQTAVSALHLHGPGSDEPVSILSAGTGSTFSTTATATLPHLVREQIERTPDAIAVRTNAESLTYRELGKKAALRADVLGSAGVGVGDVVGVHAERDIYMIADLLGISMIGASYLPLDPKLPYERLVFQIEDAQCAAVLSRSGLLDDIGAATVNVIASDAIPNDSPSSLRFDPVASATDTAYIIYTSGSTGTPKGVCLDHQSVVNRLLWMQDEYNLGTDDVVAQKTSFAFDVSVWEFFWPLLAGAQLYLLDAGVERDPRLLGDAVREQNITTIHFVPPMLDLFLADSSNRDVGNLRRVFCSGETLRSDTVEQFFRLYPAPNVELHNLYGPTEASIDVSYWQCQPDDAHHKVPIGRAVGNTNLVILDDQLQPLPFGSVGELYIGGIQLATGYINRPELTSASFIPNPWGPGRLYKTGDLASMTPEGVVYYHGRSDHQVKIRGFRVEPGEIESVIAEQPDVEQCIVHADHKLGQTGRLIAYVVGEMVDTTSLQSKLQQKLPGYMIPVRFVQLESLPTLPNGKVDRKSLPTPNLASSDPSATVTDPSTPNEQLLYQLWSETLKVESFSVDDSFFALGGDSMSAIVVRTEAEQRGYTFPVAKLFSGPSIRELAKHLIKTKVNSSELVQRAEPFSMIEASDQSMLPDGVEDAYPLSTMQAGILYHSSFAENSSVYRVVTSFAVAAPLQIDLVRQAIEATFVRHPALRSSFDLGKYSEPLQLVHTHVEPTIEHGPDLSTMPEPQQQKVIADWAEQAKTTVFDPIEPPLLRFAIHQTGDSFQLSVVEHHVVLDGWSDVAILNEIVVHYDALQVGKPLNLGACEALYSDFVLAERNTLENPTTQAYWAQRLNDVETTLLTDAVENSTAQSDLAPLTSNGHEVKRYEVELPDETTAALRAITVEHDLPLKSVLAAGHMMVLGAATGSSKPLTGIVSNGRLETAGGNETVGVFLNTLPLSIELTEQNVVDVARSVFKLESESYPHRRYPFAQLQHDSDNELQLDSYVNFMDFRSSPFPSADELMTLTIGIADTEYALATNFLVDSDDGQIGLWLDCNTAVLPESFCQRLAGYYAAAFTAIAATPSRNLSARDLFCSEERKQLDLWSETDSAYDRTATIVSEFERHVSAHGSRKAVADGTEELSYVELDARSNRLAHCLIDAGVQPGDMVGVCLARSVDLVVALLGVMKSSAAYVPLDASLPASRLEYIIEDTDIQVAITGVGTPEELRVDQTIDVVEHAEFISNQSEVSPAVALHGNQDAYVIYTSGSTGRPKGTAIRHRNVTNFFLGMDQRIGCNDDDVILAATSVSFDISVLEILWPITRGSKVVIAPDNIISNLVTPTGSQIGLEGQDPRHSLEELCQTYGVSVFQATPSLMNAIVSEPAALQALEPLRALLIGGEAFPAGLAGRLFEYLPTVDIFNMYGPTETTIWSTVHQLDPARESTTVPIGTPITNTTIKVAATNGQDVPVGVAGELWVGGDGLAREYLGRPKLTSQKFVTVEAETYYRTGDRVRWLSSGELEFLGRIDRQVKILGHRVEPDEVESVLSKHPEVEAVAIEVTEGASGPELTAFLLSPSSGSLDPVGPLHVERWADTWDDTYTKSDDQPGDSDNRFAGWISSYSGNPIPPNQMDEWLEFTIDRVREFEPSSVVDVGVGVGLVLRKLANEVERYQGFDLSSVAIERAEKCLGPPQALPDHVGLSVAGPEALRDVPPSSVDLVLCNSVAQYFPGVDYFEAVIRDSIEATKPGGIIFLGDIRSVEALPDFALDVELYQASLMQNVAELRASVAKRLQDERELCLSPSFFYQLAASHPGLQSVNVELKRGRSDNELTLFRYDVTLIVGPSTTTDTTQDVETVACELLDHGLEAIADLIANTDQAITITGIPNERLQHVKSARTALDFIDDDATVWDLHRQIWESDQPTYIHPEDLHSLARSSGRAVTIEPSPGGQLHHLDAHFHAPSIPPTVSVGAAEKNQEKP